MFLIKFCNYFVKYYKLVFLELVMHKQLQFPFWAKNFDLALLCEGKYFVFQVNTGNCETDIYEEYALLCEVEGGLCKRVFSPADYVEYGYLGIGGLGFEMTIKYMQRHGIDTVYSIAGVNEFFDDFLGLDMRGDEYDSKSGFDAWGIQSIYIDDSYMKSYLVSEGIEIKFLIDELKR